MEQDDELNKDRNPRMLATDAAVEHLMEHFEAVVILGTYRDAEGSTITISRGEGNNNARSGMLDFALRKERTRDRLRIVRQSRDE